MTDFGVIKDVVVFEPAGSAAETASFTSDERREFAGFSTATLTLNVTAITGSGATLIVDMQELDESATISGAAVWINLPGPCFLPVTTTGTWRIVLQGPFGVAVRANYTISGSSPNITFTLDAVVSTEASVRPDVPGIPVTGVSASITDTANHSIIAAQGAGRKIYITDVLVTNGHASTGTYVNIKSNTSTIISGYAAAAGGGFSAHFRVPIPAAVNVAIQAANETTGSDTRVVISGFVAA